MTIDPLISISIIMVTIMILLLVESE